jgi:hypothetical protein
METYPDLATYKRKHGSSVSFLARRLNTTRYRVYALLQPSQYPPQTSKDLFAALGDLLGRDPAEVWAACLGGSFAEEPTRSRRPTQCCEGEQPCGTVI